MSKNNTNEKAGNVRAKCLCIKQARSCPLDYYTVGSNGGRAETNKMVHKISTCVSLLVVPFAS